MNDNGRIDCGVYLFPNEVMRLLYYIDARFMFGRKFNGIVNHIDGIPFPADEEMTGFYGSQQM